MKKLTICFVVVSFILAGCSTGAHQLSGNTPTWQEQYDLGVRYLSEGNYGEAIIAFTAAIEIDPKMAPAYVGRGNAYFAMGDYSRAESDYNYALELDSSIDLHDKLNSLEEARKAELTERLQEELYPFIADLNIPFTVDDLSLGVTDIATAKAIYSSRPYAYSNLMNDDSEDTVYTCFGLDMPIPEGHKENEFGFLFAGPAEGGAIHTMIVQDPDPDFTCLGGLHVGDSDYTAFEFFGFPERLNMEDIHLRWTLENGAELSYVGNGTENYSFTYQLENYRVRVKLSNGIIYGVQLTVGSE